MKRIFFFAVFSLIVFFIYSLEPPKPFEFEKLKQNGEFAKRQEFARKLGNHILKITPDGRGEKVPGFEGLPTSGSPKIFVLLIDFSDYPHTIDSSVIQSMIFGEGQSGNYPYESLKSYYERSSYGKLHIEGDLYGWYRASNPRDYYTNNAEGLIEEAIEFYHSQGKRFDKYDNDGDGEVEYFAVFWTGPDTGWASFWWGWQSYFYDPDYTIDGKRLGTFSWQWEEDNPGTIIHETGHALGLPDYYDYDDTVGPKGGMGGLDMMDAVWGDHNAFSKWVLGWLNPVVITSQENLTLPPLSTNPYAVVLSRGFDGSDYGSEFFIVQNRYKVANDSDFAGSGLFILHIDARRDCDGYTIFDNSYTEHKLVRVMEADGLEEIEKGKWGDAEDFYFKGNNDNFGTSTFPNSDFYNGASSFATVTNISEPKEQMTADFSILSLNDLPAPQIVSPQNGQSDLGTTPEIEWNSVAGAVNYEIEIHENQNTVYKSGSIQETSFTMPSGKLISNRVYTLWLKAKGDGITNSSSLWSKIYFSTGCGDTPYFLAKTFFDPPCYTYYAGFAYYPPRGVFVRFGGNRSSETFEYDGNQWTKYSTVPAPKDRYYASLAYDPVNQKILLFGGYNYDRDEEYGDTWLYDPQSHIWQELNPPLSPPPSWAFRAATDFKRNVVVLHSPEGTWEWNGTTWTKTSTSGPKYYYGNLTYDSNLQKIVFFGGYQASTESCKNETWVYDGATWQKLSISNPPDKRCDAVLAFDKNIGKTVLWGGSNEYYDIFNDLWAFDGTQWQQVSYCGKPPEGYYDLLGAFDDKRRRLVIAKGSSETSTYELIEKNVNCAITIDPLSQTFPAEGGNGSFSFFTGDNCEWNVSKDSEWITILSPLSGRGSSIVQFSVSQNSGGQRIGHITVNEAVFEVNQSEQTVSVISIVRLSNPFRIGIGVSAPFFNEQTKVYIEKPNEPTIEWPNFKVKSPTYILIKGGKKLKKALKIPNGMALGVNLNPIDHSITLSIEEGPRI